MKEKTAAGCEYDVRARIAALREVMRERGIFAYLIPTDDFHGSEYVGDYFKCREFLTGFTGSAGTAVVTPDKAGLWTDGRYFIQAARELAGSGVELYKAGEAGVPTIEEFLRTEMPDGSALGFDGRTMTGAAVEQTAAALAGKDIRFVFEDDLVGEIWKNRPPLSEEPAWLLPVSYAGRTREDKLAEVRAAMREAGADVFLLTSLDDIAWLLNIRGNDVACNPVLLCYAMVTEEAVTLFADERKFSAEATKELRAVGVRFAPYEAVYEAAGQIAAECEALGQLAAECEAAGQLAAWQPVVWLDPERANYKLMRSLPEDIVLRCGANFTMLPKARKNETEIEYMRKTHVKDGAATTKLIYWLKNSAAAEGATELSVMAKMEELRGQQKDYIGPSFETIAAYGENGAIIHYTADEKSDTALAARGFILVDTGGVYMGGTTDVTRTVALGALTEEEKVHYTAVLKGNLALGSTLFPAGTCGWQLDAIARRPIWAVGCDYKHGTGHGVGYMLNVHEGPNAIRSRASRNPAENVPIEPGMITSNEPGIYIEGSHGIRLETLTLCRCAETMLCFETLTLAPFDRDAILTEMLSADERAALNAYHARVYREIAPYLDADEAAWLRGATRPL